ncbi:MAG: insulinase family protein [Spirochaetes bacterium]|nr:insulinase family protein [Spirochaetota bacterium]
MSFSLKEERRIPEIASTARLYVHDGTGARVLSVVNADENKAFGISFRTPPKKSDGVAHILEHSVLCGSDKYPVKEPFVELIKGSLNTFLNAFTYPDKTVYPLASTNLKDFRNLIDVYFDAVFHPLIAEDTFRQEGWHYEVDPETGVLDYKGVVFNEMKGAYSDPDDQHDDLCRRSLFPDTAYGLDSGGDPAIIPSLDYPTFKRFHETYYHPSNSYIFFYGDDEPDERLAIVERWLSPYSRLEIDSLPALQKPFDTPLGKTAFYESEEAKAWTAVNWAFAGSEDPETKLARTILSHILIGTPASPLRVALIHSGLGEDLAGFGLEDDIRQGAFSAGLKGVSPENAPKVEAVVLETLAKLTADGIDPDAVAASMNTVEFALREKNTGRFPRGLAVMLEGLGEWLYGGNPMDALAFAEPLERIKRGVAAGRYFEPLIGSSFLGNNHRSTVTLLPEAKAGTKLAEAERKALDASKASMTQAELASTAEAARRLKARQEKPDSPEALATIPSLGLADLPSEPVPIPSERREAGDSILLFHDIPTCSILYLDIAFSLDFLSDELLPYVGLFGRVLLEMGAGDMDYIALSREIGKKTGGIGASTLTASKWRKPGTAARFILRSKTLASNADRLFKLLSKVLRETRIDDRERFRQIVLEEKAQAEASLIPSGHRVLSLRLRARFTEADAMSERIGGVEQLFFLRRLAERLDKDWKAVLSDLESVRAALINARGAVFNATIDAEAFSRIEPAMRVFMASLPAGPRKESAARGPLPGPAMEFLTAPTQVNFVGTAYPLGSGGARLGAFLVVKNYLDTTFLWENVRVKGGAYGGFSSFDLNSGLFIFLSYRDPNLEKTIEVFSKAGDFLGKLNISREELTRSIIGTIGGVDAYLLPDAKGFTSLVHFLTGYTYEDRQAMRKEILSASPEDFKALSAALAATTARSGALSSRQRIEALPAALKTKSETTTIM